MNIELRVIVAMVLVGVCIGIVCGMTMCGW